MIVADQLNAAETGSISASTDGGAHVDLPRNQSGARPQRLLLSLLGDYWQSRREHVPSAALVRLLSDFGVTPVGARAAVSRLARRGLLASSKLGRRTYYGLTADAARVVSEDLRRVLSFGLASTPWTGQWTVAAFSLPEQQRDLRHLLRTRLRYLGLAPLYDGLWVAPGGSAASPTARVLAELGISTGTVFQAMVAPASPLGGDPLSAWDLAGLRTRYQEFITEHAPLLVRVRRGEVDGAQALAARAAVMDVWRSFPNLDPELPDELLPQPWPRRPARDVFIEIYDALGPPAETWFRHVLTEFAPPLAPLARHQGSWQIR